jgi:hypothetical protein
MAIPKKGSRKISIDGITYRWSIRANPTYSEANEWSNLKATVELYDSPASVLSIDFMVPRNDSWISNGKVKVTPADICICINQSISLGWDSSAKGDNHFLEYNPYNKPLKQDK